MSIARKVEIVFGIMFLLLLASFFLVNYYLNAIEKDVKLLTIADDMVEDILQARRHEKNYFLRANPAYLALVRNYSWALQTHAREFERIAYRPQDQEIIEQVYAQIKKYRDGFEYYVVAGKDASADPESAALIDSGRAILKYCQDFRNSASVAITHKLNTIIGQKVILLLLFIIISLMVFYWTVRTVVAPVRKLAQVSTEIGREGIFNPGQMKLIDDMIKNMGSNDEIQELARVYREMLIRCNNSCLGLEEKIKEVETLCNLKSEFTSVVSHELRTPLAPIKEGIDLVLEQALGPINDSQKELLGIAKRNVERLIRLINDVLDFAKLTSRKAEFQVSAVRVNDLINSVVEVYRRVIEKKGLSCRVELTATDGLNVEINEDRINQVLSNLFDNAVKFTETGGITITTSLAGEGRYVTVCMKDTGIGIAAGDLDKLFQAFSQLGNKGNRKTGGTGLGLAICREILEQSGGRVWVESEPGKGSKFCFSLPIQADKVV